MTRIFFSDNEDKNSNDKNDNKDNINCNHDKGGG